MGARRIRGVEEGIQGWQTHPEGEIKREGYAPKVGSRKG